LVLGPVIRRVLQEGGLAEARAISWTAEQKRGKQGSDFLRLARNGYRLAGARFVVRPDYAFPLWHAGFRLTRATENLEESDLRATLLVQITQTYFGGKVGHSSHRQGVDYGPWALPRSANPTPSFLFDLSILPSAQAGSLRLVYSINADTPQALDFAAEYAEQLVLVGWADGADFRVHFEQVSLSWGRS